MGNPRRPFFLLGVKFKLIVMKSIFSDQLSDFSSIHLNDVELVSVSRPNFDSIENSLKFLETRESLNLRWIQNLETDNRLNDLSESIPSILRSMLISQIDDSSKILYEHMGCCKVEVRLAILRSPMCPLFTLITLLQDYS